MRAAAPIAHFHNRIKFVYIGDANLMPGKKGQTAQASGDRRQSYRRPEKGGNTLVIYANNHNKGAVMVDCYIEGLIKRETFDPTPYYDAKKE